MRWLLLLGLIFGVGCGPSPQGPEDGGVNELEHDAGPQLSDGGGWVDAGVPDAGSQDAGVADAGLPDAGGVDAGPNDAGTPDAGTGVDPLLTRCSGSPVGYVNGAVQSAQMAVDSLGQPHVAYRAGALCYARWNGASWDTSVIDAQLDYSVVSLTLDSLDRPHLGYVRDDEQTLGYARWDGSSWVHQVVHKSVTTKAQVSVALDAQGAPHLTYVERVSYQWRPRHVFLDSGKWLITSFGSATYQAEHIGLAVDPSGTVCVAFRNTQDGSIKFGMRQAGSWTMLDVAPHTGGYDAYPSVAFGPAGIPHLSFRGQNGRLQLATWVGGSWTLTEVDSNTSSVSLSEVKVDTFDQPHLLYWDTISGLVKYARWQAGQWVSQTVSQNQASWGLSLSVGATGGPMALFIGKEKDLHHLRWVSGQWRSTLLEPSTFTEYRVSLGVLPNHQPVIAFSTSARKLLLASWDGTHWRQSVIAAQGHQPSLVVDGAGTVHVAYPSAGALKYARRVSGGWTTTSVDPSSVVSQPSLAVDAQGTLHLAYTDYQNRDLKYARLSGAQPWSIATVDSAGNTGEEPSIAVDDAGHPHISYSRHEAKELKYARWTGTGWALSTVSQGSTGQMTSSSIGLSPQGHPHIAYEDLSQKALKLASWNGSQWVLETIESGGSAPSMVVDANGEVRVSYYHYQATGLKLATRRQTGWTTTVLDPGGSAGFWSSLKLDSAGAQHLAHYDGEGQGIKYLR